MNVTFSSDTGLTFEDVQETSRLSERTFKTAHDAAQMRVADEKTRWIFLHRPETDNVIKMDGKVIGFTFIVLTNTRIMRDFLSGKISEEDIFTLSKQVTKRTFTAIYLCASVILPEFRRKGLALRGFVKQIRNVTGTKKPALFYWGYSKEGALLAEKVAKESGLPVHARA
ncbi:hypothetical protein HY493_02645 [Candidatus Woesearchaeota archaeon]|nr:hypothetical protein [Candidatus Woesearchaeota archaeon]